MSYRDWETLHLLKVIKAVMVHQQIASAATFYQAAVAVLVDLDKMVIARKDHGNQVTAVSV